MIVDLRSAREAAGITQRELAERAGVTTRTVIRLEVDAGQNPNIATVNALAKALGVTVDDLIHDPDGTAAPSGRQDVAGPGQEVTAAAATPARKSQEVPGSSSQDETPSATPRSRKRRMGSR